MADIINIEDKKKEYLEEMYRLSDEYDKLLKESEDWNKAHPEGIKTREDLAYQKSLDEKMISKTKRIMEIKRLLKGEKREAYSGEEQNYMKLTDSLFDLYNKI